MGETGSGKGGQRGAPVASQQYRLSGVGNAASVALQLPLSGQDLSGLGWGGG